MASFLHRIRHPKHWKLAIAFWVIVLGLVGFRLYLPTIVTHIVNRKLNEIPGYRGHIDGVHIHLWRGAYTIDEPYLKKEDGKIDQPFLEAHDVDISVNWPALLHLTIVATVTFDGLRVNLVNGPSKGQSQTGIDLSGLQKLRSLVPLRIDEAEVNDGEVHYGDPWGKPPFDIYLREIELVARNLTNSDKISKTLVATLAIKGMAMKSGHFELNASIDPYAKKPTFEAKLELKELALKELNEFLKDSLAVECTDGRLTVFAEAAVKEGHIKGYVKPLIRGLEVVKIKEDASLGQTLEGVGVQIVSAIFRNRPHEQIGAKIELGGTLEKPDFSVWDTIVSVLKNAFIQALEPKFDNTAAINPAPDKGGGGGQDTEKMKDSREKTQKELDQKVEKKSNAKDAAKNAPKSEKKDNGKT